ncbi:glycosyltransferase family 1 protein [Flavobacterium sp. ZB4P23]|uniref:glycosyltransferase family 4 protein n=1 Tax=unclassified Flavobacterium TaxID=196869 RepID=UPI000F83B671|nr:MULTISPECIES: glycosyltransferase family 1 protein [unclassified Flavobacterium]RTY83742.1 glycosyltransferase family 1 protein [Flavobacterium sp. ZB4P23]RTZ06728.1 glycosyltransferase family 1 protein [Flavobacterium sp. GSP6]
MNVIIDLIAFSLQKSGGVSVYWYEIINRMLIQSDSEHLFIEENGKKENIFRKELKIQENHFINEKTKLSNYFSRYREINLKISNKDFIFHSTYYRTLTKVVKKRNNVKEVVTVHDFTYEYFSKGLKKWVHCYQKKKAINAADVVICISENTKKDLLYFYPQFSSKEIRVVYNGVSLDYFKIPELIRENNNSSFFLFVGSRAKYKNFDFTVKALAQTKDFSLKIVGGDLNDSEILMLNELIPDRWELHINIENKELNVLYNTAFALLYPSSYEGFGIPLLEAMKAGCPFIAYNNSSIPEVAGNAGVLIDQLKISLFNEAVLHIEKNRIAIIKKGFDQVGNFSWEKCYQETLQVYLDLNRS